MGGASNIGGKSNRRLLQDGGAGWWAEATWAEVRTQHGVRQCEGRSRTGKWMGKERLRARMGSKRAEKSNGKLAGRSTDVSKQ